MENLPQKVASFPSDKDFRPLTTVYFAEVVAGGSPLTAIAKRNDLKKFLLYYETLNGHLRANEWQARDSRIFLDELQKQGYMPATINRALATMRTFGKWLREKQVLFVDPCRGIKDLQLAVCQPKGVRDLEYHRVCKAADVLVSRSPTKISQDVRNRAILELLNSSGLRISEVLSLRINQVVGKKLINVRCKGGKYRDILVTKHAAGLVSDYIHYHRTSEEPWVFVNRYGGRLSAKGAGEGLAKIAAYANATLPEVEKVHLYAHRLRHRHGYKCREAKDPVFAAKRLGHGSLKYIERYATTSERDEEAIVESL
jgi:site-specific recombinase XerD